MKPPPSGLRPTGCDVPAAAYSRSMRTTFVLAVALAGCASTRIHSEVAPNTDLGRYRTFGWLANHNGGPVSIVDQHVRDALAEQLTRQGLQQVPAESADFLVTYHVLQEHKVAVADWGNGIYGWAPEVVAYSDGALIVDFIDPRTNRVIWRGSAGGAVDRTGTIDVKRLRRAAAALVGTGTAPKTTSISHR
jgi:hypothetical protein